VWALVPLAIDYYLARHTSNNLLYPAWPGKGNKQRIKFKKEKPYEIDVLCGNNNTKEGTSSKSSLFF
jgi:hypothetical protein